MQQGILKRIINLGLPDSFVEHGTREEILAVCGLDEDSILERIQNTAAELQQQP